MDFGHEYKRFLGFAGGVSNENKERQEILLPFFLFLAHVLSRIMFSESTVENKIYIQLWGIETCLTRQA